VNPHSIDVNPVFSTKKEAENLLGELDVYTSNLNEFELMAKLQVFRQVTVSDYLNHVKEQALDWDNELKELILGAIEEISNHLDINPMPLPKDVHFVLTTGLDEGFAAYTRGSAIFLNERIIQNHRNLSGLIAHELVHVATRNNGKWKDNLYSQIGFLPCDPPAFTPEFQKYVFSNPDAPRIEHALEVTYEGVKHKVAPIIYTSQENYLGGNFFEYIEVGLFLIDGENATDHHMYPEENRIIDFDDCQEFFENVGNNTNYLFHAEEILADNIADIYANRLDYESPEIIRKILQILNNESF
jgi:hypothetical protein|tara:strand:- start:246 stop:1145 length:900 start_codon:yes stop_codon:yes gene_type:complete